MKTSTPRKRRSQSDTFLQLTAKDKGKLPDRLMKKYFPYTVDAEWLYTVTVESSKMPYPKMTTYAKDGEHILRIAHHLLKKGVGKDEIFCMAEHRDDLKLGALGKALPMNLPPAS